MNSYPADRAEAKRTGAKYYFTGKPCSRGHVALRKTKGVCVECMKEGAEKAYATRADYFKQYRRRDDVKDRQHEWYLAHKDEVVDRAASRSVEEKKRHRKAWKAANIDKIRADTKNRRRKHRLATPSWLTKQQKGEMRELYRIAIMSTKITSERYVVDHICPLRAENSCGLHVPWNLQVMTERENLLKGNTVPEGAGMAFPDGSGPKRS